MIPKNFEFLTTTKGLPKIVAIALQYLGIKEFATVDKNNPVIMGFANLLGLPKSVYPNDETAWCALFVNVCLKLAGKPSLKIKKNFYNYLRAAFLLTYDAGQKVTFNELLCGDVVVIDRPGGAHTFIFLAYTDKNDMWGIGGNQSNSVTIAEFERGRFLGAFRPPYERGNPEGAQKFVVGSKGLISTNEA